MTDEAPLNRVEELLGQILQAPDDRLIAELDSMCEAYPEHAVELRRYVAVLTDIGLGLPPSKPARRWMFQAGERLAAFEIVEPLGAGGMGQVYRAVDLELNREVAIKVLPTSMADDPLKLLRFEREAQSLATLNHPRIAHIHQFVREGDISFLVMGLIEGTDLSDLLAEGRLPLEESVRICLQITEGLQAAHDAGIIHRDLKPSNVRLTDDGKLKLLDFGLAKSAPSRVVPETTRDTDLTREGAFLGTAVYMSPEQLSGRELDRRTDVWSFGCILFECLAGRRPFTGDSVVEIMAAVIEREPDWSALPIKTPAYLRSLLERCLEKDPAQRLQDIGEARVALQRGGTQTSRLSGAPAAGPGPSVWTAWALAAVALVVLVTYSILGVPEVHANYAAIHLAPDQFLSTRAHPNLAISADGRRIAWVGGKRRKLFVKDRGEFTPREFPDEGVSSPFFSPDGESVAYFRDNVLWKVSLGSDSTKRVMVVDERNHQESINDYSSQNRGGTWIGNWIVFAPSIADGLFRVRDSGEKDSFGRLTARAKGERSHRWPQAIPEHGLVLFTSGRPESTENYDDASILTVDVDEQDPEPRLLFEEASMARYANGYLVFARGGNLLMRRCDPEDPHAMEADGDTLHSRLRMDISSGAAQFALASDGTLVYAEDDPMETRQRLAWRDATGQTRVIAETYGALEPSYHPVAKKVAYTQRKNGKTNIFVYDEVSGTNEPLTTSGTCHSPVWLSKDTIAFHSRDKSGDGTREKEWGIFTIRANLSGEETVLIRTPDEWAHPYQSVPDQDTLLTSWRRSRTDADLVSVGFNGTARRTILDSARRERHPALSPDGRLLAYTVHDVEENREHVYLRPYDATAGWVKRVSSSGGKHPGGSEPRWSGDGKTIYFLRAVDEELWGVEVERTTVAPTAEPTLHPPKLVMSEFCAYQSVVHFHYSIAPGDSGDRFLTAVGGTREHEIRVVIGGPTSRR